VLAQQSLPMFPQAANATLANRQLRFNKGKATTTIRAKRAVARSRSSTFRSCLPSIGLEHAVPTSETEPSCLLCGRSRRAGAKERGPFKQYRAYSSNPFISRKYLFIVMPPSPNGSL
jgi:hypothetical protein